MSSSPNYLILGIAAGYKANLIMSIFEFLRETVYPGRVCLFVSSLDEAALSQIRAYAREVVSLYGLYRKELTKPMAQFGRTLICCAGFGQPRAFAASIQLCFRQDCISHRNLPAKRFN